MRLGFLLFKFGGISFVVLLLVGLFFDRWIEPYSWLLVAGMCPSAGAVFAGLLVSYHISRQIDALIQRLGDANTSVAVAAAHELQSHLTDSETRDAYGEKIICGLLAAADQPNAVSVKLAVVGALHADPKARIRWEDRCRSERQTSPLQEYEWRKGVQARCQHEWKYCGSESHEAIVKGRDWRNHWCEKCGASEPHDYSYEGTKPEDMWGQSECRVCGLTI